ncbi:hypothetical protein JVU11DRAFT_4374 [Chiua virens]|nr:hypothetical protein JVU11DRAFT_4374 [Chiua virens]
MMRLLSDDMRSSHLAESGGESSQAGGNVAVAIIDEPTFVRKSTILLRFLRERLAAVVRPSDSLNRCAGIPESGRNALYQFPSPELTFLMGSDTLVRLFSPKYYPSEQAMVQMLRKFLSPDEEGSRIVCADRLRGTANLNAVINLDKAQLEVAHEFVQSDRITFIDIGAEEQTYSSTEVRAKVAARDGSWMRLVTTAIASYIITHEIYLG